MEVDGNSHNATIERDEERDHYLASQGLQTLRVTNHDVRDHLEGVLTTIEQACASRKPHRN